jgi:3-hydroxybutyryl-CoA dehydrogenase
LIATNLALYVFFAKNWRMTIGIIADNDQKEALLSQVTGVDFHIEWMDHPGLLPAANAVIDFSNSVENYPASWLESDATLLFINQVEEVLSNTPAHFIRFNGWPGFWQRPLLEASCTKPGQQAKAEDIMALFGKKVEWVTDLPGFLSARVLASIINEAYLALEEGVSSKPEIDTAMKLGTNYPFGPFEWCEKIGANRIYLLLNEMAVNNQRYLPSSLLKKEAGC